MNFLKKSGAAAIILLITAAICTTAAPRPGQRPFRGSRLQTGLTVRMDKLDRIWALDLPVLEFSLPFVPERFFLDLGVQLQFGTEDFFIDGYSSLAFRIQAVPRILHFYVKYMLGTGIVFADHYSHILEAGGGLGVPLTLNTDLVLSGGYYHRVAERLLDYLYGDRYYTTVSGWTFRAALRWRL